MGENLKVMFEQILGQVKDQVAKSIGGISGIPADKQSAVVDTTASSLMSGLKQFATPDKLSSLLGGGGAAASGLSGGVVSALTSKVGLNANTAKGIAAAVIPAVLGLLKKQSGGSGGIGSLVSALSGGGGLGNMLGGIMGGGSSAGAGAGLGGMLGGLMGGGAQHSHSAGGAVGSAGNGAAGGILGTNGGLLGKLGDLFNKK